MFVKATKTKAKLRMALHGPSGAGKTVSALSIGKHLVPEGKRIALLDTEKGSASKYSDMFDFDVCEVVGNYAPKRLIDTLDAAVKGGYGLLIVDSMTHFWNGPGGFLEMIDEEVNKMKARNQRPDTFAAWKTIDPIYRRMVDTVLASPIHVIMTLRAKQAYEKVEGDNGRTKIQKLGMAPQMRDDFQYEWDCEGMLDIEHNLVIGKTRCPALDGRVFKKPGKDVADILAAWLDDGAERAPSRHTAFLERVKAATNADEYKAAADTYQADKATYRPEELQEQMRALRAKYDELKATADAG